MKKIFVLLFSTAMLSNAFAQSDKYQKAMEVNVVAVDTTRNPEALRELSSKFERIADSEKTQWLPYYYAALTQVNAALRMMADPMSRYMQYGPEAQKALEMAKQLNANNPRVYLLEGQDKFFTPEQYGGSKVEAKRLFEEAMKKYDAFKTTSALEPTWGRGTTQYFLLQSSK
jgi:hypothetical protein